MNGQEFWNCKYDLQRRNRHGDLPILSPLERGMKNVLCPSQLRWGVVEAGRRLL
jgi:hypothetical protein